MTGSGDDKLKTYISKSFFEPIEDPEKSDCWKLTKQIFERQVIIC